MDLTYLKKIIRIVENSGVDEIEVEEEGLRVRVAKNSQGHVVPVTGIPQPVVGQTAVPAVSPAPVAAKSEGPETKYHEIKSPIVGTFYRARSRCRSVRGSRANDSAEDRSLSHRSDEADERNRIGCRRQNRQDPCRKR